MSQHLTNSKEETQKLGEEFANTLNPGDFVAFYGDLGSGKTTFIQGLAKGLGIKRRIISPTFIIVRHYAINNGNFYHVDLYRTASRHDLLGIGLDQLINDENGIVALEWAEKMGEMLPEKRIEVKLHNLGRDKRKITIKSMSNQIDQAVKILNQGGIIIFPTDTAFGIGCRIDREEAIQKLFKIRRRPKSQATPVLVSDLQMARDYVQEISEEVTQKLINPYWPGALTIVLKAREDRIPSLVRGGGQTIGIRIPNNQTILGIIKRVGVPILGPSANFHGEATPYELKDLNKDLISLVDYIVKGECLVKNTSTVIDCTQTPWKILRQGAILLKI